MSGADRYDHTGCSWYASKAQDGEHCCVCRRALRRGSRVLTERVLPGMNVRPKVLHPNKCWLEHLRSTSTTTKAKGTQVHAG